MGNIKNYVLHAYRKLFCLLTAIYSQAQEFDSHWSDLHLGIVSLDEDNPTEPQQKNKWIVLM